MARSPIRVCDVAAAGAAGAGHGVDLSGRPIRIRVGRPRPPASTASPPPRFVDGGPCVSVSGTPLARDARRFALQLWRTAPRPLDLGHDLPLLRPPLVPSPRGHHLGLPALLGGGKALVHAGIGLRPANSAGPRPPAVAARGISDDHVALAFARLSAAARGMSLWLEAPRGRLRELRLLRRRHRAHLRRRCGIRHHCLEAVDLGRTTPR